MLSRVRGDGVLRGQPDLPAQLSRFEVQGVEGVVPGSCVHGVADHRRRRRHGVAGREEPGLAQRSGPTPRSGWSGRGRCAGRRGRSWASPTGRRRPAPPTGAARAGWRRTRAVPPHPPSTATTARAQHRRPAGFARRRVTPALFGAHRGVSRSRRSPGVSEAGPRAGAGFSDGPDSGATILPIGYGQRIRGRDAHRHAGREVEPARHRHRGRRLPVRERHPHDPAPVGRRPAAGEGPAARDVDVDEVERPVGGEGHAERVVLVRALAEVGHRRAGHRAPSRLGAPAGADPDDGGVADVAADGEAAARRVLGDAGGEGQALDEGRHLHLARG